MASIKEEIMRGKVLGIYVCRSAGMPMQAVDRVMAIQGGGLFGDRYLLGVGVYSSSKRETIRHVSVIANESIRVANLELDDAFTPEETRRNILVEGVPLNDLVGKTFTIRETRFRGVELCDPCDRPSHLAKKPGFRTAFGKRGGLRAEVLSTGEIGVGDEVFYEE